MDRRFFYLNNLKVLTVVGVIVVHAAIVYGVGRSFYLDYDSMADVSVGVLTTVAGVGFLFGLVAYLGHDVLGRLARGAVGPQPWQTWKNWLPSVGICSVRDVTRSRTLHRPSDITDATNRNSKPRRSSPGYWLSPPPCSRSSTKAD